MMKQIGILFGILLAMPVCLASPGDSEPAQPVWELKCATPYWLTYAEREPKVNPIYGSRDDGYIAVWLQIGPDAGQDGNDEPGLDVVGVIINCLLTVHGLLCAILEGPAEPMAEGAWRIPLRCTKLPFQV